MQHRDITQLLNPKTFIKPWSGIVASKFGTTHELGQMVVLSVAHCIDSTFRDKSETISVKELEEKTVYELWEMTEEMFNEMVNLFHKQQLEDIYNL